MNIDINLDTFVDLIMNPHNAKETADIVLQYCDEEEIVNEHYSDIGSFWAYAFIIKHDMNYIISNFDDTGFIVSCALTYLENKGKPEEINSDNLCKLLDMLIDEGYIMESGLREISETADPIKYFRDIKGNFAWSTVNCKTVPRVTKNVEALVLEYMKDFGTPKFCSACDEWTSTPFDFIEEQYFSGFNGAKEEDVLSILFENFNKLKEDYIEYFGDIMPITKDTTLDEFRHMCYDADYNAFRDAYYELIHVSDFLHDTGVFDNYFG